ncbi:NapA-type sodium/hydrogen antiporter [Thermococcus kodakarensis KOD1]|uniref:NapA-type sodium/hydrogen antiporter n=1 Tax=Thermococcus kodakarensis (strain ATCC BAA-918 / JCM 12380 / KOD1) TaxID=69014 RepID=Q5JI36_THEKO|nr:cation:proton antiporter [Thermococcus kodakarensis]WCN28877.1 cation:proton antiporter [Thermococcus kodakarensis]WCN31180.1 cation:proton antiporter [Thermococcus kodakarensis]BAD85073.1 NapA-type sodium/hydrogen antiporter [Thermococcus kodakarensis KOD1]
MEGVAWLLATIGIALILAKIGDSIIERFELPGVLGELIMGMILGNLVYFGYVAPDYLPIVSGMGYESVLNQIAEFLAKLGIIFLLFLGALDADIEQLKKTGLTATVSTVLGVFVPLVLGWWALMAMGYPSREAFAGGVLLTATSIGLTVRVMMDLGVLRSEVGAASLSASVMDDFLGIALIIFAVGTGSLFELSIKIVAFFIITGVLGWYFIDHYIRFAERLHVEKGILGMAIGMMFLFAALAEGWFAAAIEGAFMMGLILSKLPEGKRIMEDVRAIGYGLLIPFFFVHTGAMLNLKVFEHGDAITLAAVLSVIAIVGKIVGRGFGAWITAWGRGRDFLFTRENFWMSLQMGIGSVPRTEVALVNLMVAIHGGAIPSTDAPKFIAATLIFITVSVLITPPLLKWAFKAEIEKAKAEKAAQKVGRIQETKEKIKELKGSE